MSTKINNTFIITQEFLNSIKKDVTIAYLFSQYTENTVNNIDHPSLIKEWKSNIENSEYKSNDDNHVVKPTPKIELDQCLSE